MSLRWVFQVEVDDPGTEQTLGLARAWAHNAREEPQDTPALWHLASLSPSLPASRSLSLSSSGIAVGVTFTPPPPTVRSACSVATAPSEPPKSAAAMSTSTTAPVPHLQGRLPHRMATGARGRPWQQRVSSGWKVGASGAGWQRRRLPQEHMSDDHPTCPILWANPRDCRRSCDHAHHTSAFGHCLPRGPDVPSSSVLELDSLTSQALHRTRTRGAMCMSRPNRQQGHLHLHQPTSAQEGDTHEVIQAMRCHACNGDLLLREVVSHADMFRLRSAQDVAANLVP